jgi:catechol 2,3-dioxygenase-like lactoylglutathione lyase family enzyme
VIDKLTHTTVWVLDQEEALEFYTQKLGFQLHTDARVGDFRLVIRLLLRGDG